MHCALCLQFYFFQYFAKYSFASLQLHGYKNCMAVHSLYEKTIDIVIIYERLKFAAEYWVPSAGAKATGRQLFSAEGIHNCDLILITLPEGW